MIDKRSAYFLQVNDGDVPLHGGVGYFDADRTMKNAGLTPVSFPNQRIWYPLLKLKQLFRLISSIKNIQGQSIFFFQFPLYHRFGKWLIRSLTRSKNIRPVCLLMDIEGMRDNDEETLQKEINELRQYHFFIVHNNRMQNWLQTIHPGAESAMLEFFDFLTQPFQGKRRKSFSLAWAGHLDKAAFVKNLHSIKNSPNVLFDIYGPGDATTILGQPNVSYKGTVYPYQLPAAFTASFGLVWDGESIEKPEGSTGKYLEYNSPHKLSLYIVSGLPVIAPQNTAAGDLVSKYKIGFCISSLYELEQHINNLTEEEYGAMIDRMRPLAQRISNGECLQSAIQKIIGLTALGS